MNPISLPASLSYLPAFYGSETLYSLVCRFHFLSGHLYSTDTSLLLFADRVAGFRTDFPGNLQRFSKATGELLGDAPKLSRERTVWGFYRPFVSETMQVHIEAQMQGVLKRDLGHSLGIMPSRVSFPHLLKACKKCMRRDIQNYGVAIWRVEHQWPSSWICERHGSVLQYVPLRVKRVRAQKWVLPEDVQKDEWSAFRLAQSAKHKLRMLFKLSSAICKSSHGHFSSGALRVCYLIGVQRRGWMAPDGSIRFSTLRKAFYEYYRELAKLPGFDIVLGAQLEHGGMLGVLMRQYPGTRHPLKHLLLIAFLFESPELFFASYAEAFWQLQQNDCDVRLVGKEIGGAWKDALRYLVESEKLSVSAAAKNLRIPLSQAVRQAHKDKLSFAARPRVLNTEGTRAIQELAPKGMSYSEMSLRLGIKASSIRRYMASNTDVRELWKLAGKLER
ncbi:MAG TPA: TnsD family Tn7-like transposition protein [Noviherbaspirillum sp.]|uniref:TnsD family Tn7-like transposition protein n=1 Tax=Noviherbaspirillum sp. TaxID=1926288 RepID=UPI002B4A8507|nr:TnsD family Tn7-like transposition protein [Noviherbaspirillum sp.]HJV86063.1 TnsD family Tn7-like transposition protein [Noviherbaspirillum sp.]